MSRSSEHNRRAAFRLSVSLALEVRADDGEPGTECWDLDDVDGRRVLSTVTEDLSAAGARLRSPQPLRVGARLALRLDLAGEPLAADADVVRVAGDVFGAAVAVAFDRPSHAVTERLTRFVTACERRRLPRVEVMYPVRCEVAARRRAIPGTTLECSPGFVELLLDHEVAPMQPITVGVVADRSVVTLRGAVVWCRAEHDVWRTAVELDEPVNERWKTIVVDRRDGRR